MNVSAFIRSYRKDFAWLRLCLMALNKYGGQFSEVVIVIPGDDYEQLIAQVHGIALDHHLPIRYVPIVPQAVSGYIDQQITKCHADQYCKGDFIMHFDSDCIAEAGINMPDFFAAGRPKLLFRKWQDAGTAETWRLVTKGVLKQEPPFETMASHPFLYHRSTHELFRRHVGELHGGDFVKYASRLAQFSEFNALGNFALLFTPDAYSFVRAGDGDGWPRPFKQYWSHGSHDMRAIEASIPRP